MGAQHQRQGPFFKAAPPIFSTSTHSKCSKHSDSDQPTTQQLKEALGLMDIQVIDHVVVGSEGCTSFAEMRYL
ncbi:JAB domain-containing protein [Aidingimonas lacisalsi]|uniref:JAB domain-containing protein n=1 Tax=Aidingimonas lacisalsi TaxID=2604086 RepID=UPI0011D229BD